MSLEEIFAKIPKISKKRIVKGLKQRRKFCCRARKWVKRDGCYAISTGDTKCLECGKIAFGHRLGCSCFVRGQPHKGVVHGAAINIGEIGRKDRWSPLIQQSEFISYRDLFKRLQAGDRFFDFGKKRELTVSDFQ